VRALEKLRAAVAEVCAVLRKNPVHFSVLE
jgi:hypothetical protein